MKITRVVKQIPVVSIAAKDIPIGTVFDGNVSAYIGPFLRTYKSFVSISSPNHTWDPIETILIENYRVLDAELLIHEPVLPATSAQ